MNTGSYNLKSYTVLDSKTAVLAVSLSKDGAKGSLEDLGKELKLNILANTCSVLDDSPYTVTVRVLARAQIHAKPDNEVERSRLIATAKNFYMDDEDYVWKTEGGMLIRQDTDRSAEELEQLLQANCSSPMPKKTAAYAAMASHSDQFHGAHFAAVAFPGKTRYGFIVATNDSSVLFYDMYLVEAKEGPEEVNKEWVISAVDMDAKYLRDDNGLATASSLDEALTYYRKLFSYAPDYLKEVERLVKEQITKAMP